MGFVIILALIAILFAYGIVQFCRTPKEETETRKSYKMLIIITSVLLGIIVVGAISLSFLLILAVAHM